MPLTTTHALLPLAATIAFARRPISWPLVVAAAAASAAPDIDGLAHRLLGVPAASIWTHRGAAHSLFLALAVGALAALFHKRLGARRLVAGVVVFAAMASHGLLDMMTDSGLPVAYLWPLSSVRLFADWRPIHSTPVHAAHVFSQGYARFMLDFWQLVLPMFVLAIIIRVVHMGVPIGGSHSRTWSILRGRKSTGGPADGG